MIGHPRAIETAGAHVGRAQPLRYASSLSGQTPERAVCCDSVGDAYDMPDNKMTKSVGEHWVCATLARHRWAPALTRDARGNPRRSDAH
jgi:hypothetical protein